IGMAAAAILLWLYAQLLGTPYQAAKALTVAAPLVMLISVTGFIGLRPGGGEWWRQLLRIPAAAAFVFAAALSTLLILGNGPVGPDKWSPLLNQIRPLDEPVVVSAPEGWLDGDHGADITRWELR